MKFLSLEIHDLTSKSEADESSLHSDQVITHPRSVSSMYSFSSLPAHPQASLAPSLSTTVLLPKLWLCPKRDYQMSLYLCLLL